MHRVHYDERKPRLNDIERRPCASGWPDAAWNMLPRGAGDVAGVEAAAAAATAGYPFTTGDDYDGDGKGDVVGVGGGQLWRGRRSLPECGDSPVIRGFIPLVWVGGPPRHACRDLARLHAMVVA